MNKEKSNKNNIISLALMLFITGITQILTLMKSSMVAGTFGTSIEMDAYNFANSIVSFIFGFIASGISTVVIPYYARKEGKKVDPFITLLYLVTFIIIVVLILFRFKIVGIFSNKGELFINLSCNILIILLLSNFLYSISNVTLAYFQCNNKYNLPKVITLLSQLIVIIGLLLINDLTIIQYSIIIAIGLIFNFILDIIFALKSGWRFSASFNFNNRTTKKMIKLFFPVVFSTGIYKLSLLVDSIISANLDTGKITILSYSSQITNIFNTVFVGTLLTYLYPKIVKQINKDNSQKVFWNQTIFFHFIVCFVIVLFFNCGFEGVKLLFQHGKFSLNDSKMVYISSLIYIFGQQINIVRDLIYRYFYAKEITSIAAKNSIIVSITNILLSLIFVYLIGYYGIILGTVVSSIISLIVIIFEFRNTIGFEFKVNKILLCLLKNNFVLLLTIIIIQITKNFIIIDNSFLNIIIFSIETILIYILLTFIICKNNIETLKQI